MTTVNQLVFMATNFRFDQGHLVTVCPRGYAQGKHRAWEKLQREIKALDHPRLYTKRRRWWVEGISRGFDTFAEAVGCL